MAARAEHLTCRAFLPGFNFELVDHPDQSQDREWLITQVDHEATASGYRAGRPDEPSRYTVQIVPADVPFQILLAWRAGRSCRSADSARGRPGRDEIYPDKFG